MPDLKAISIRQPWAYSACVGTKPVENRTRKTNYRGPLVIHAGSQKAGLNELIRELGKQNVPSQLFTFGAAIGVVDLVDVVEMHRGLEDTPSANGPICLLFKNARLFAQPISITGQLGVFRITGPDAERVQQAIESAKPVEPPDEFLQFLKRVREQPAERLRDLVLTYSDMGKDEDVLRLADQAIKENPDDAFVYAARGVSKYRTIDVDDDEDGDVFLAHLDEAIHDLDRAISLDDKQALFRLWRAGMYHLRGEPEKKAADIAAGRTLDPQMDWELVESGLPEAEDEFGFDDEDDDEDE